MALSDIEKATKPLTTFSTFFALFHNKRASWIFSSTIVRRVLFNFFFSVWISIRDFPETLSSLRQYSRKGRQQTNYLFNFLTGDTSYLENITLLTHSTPIQANIKIGFLIEFCQCFWSAGYFENATFTKWAAWPN